MAKTFAEKKNHPLELKISKMAGQLGVNRGAVLRAIGESQGVTRKTVYFWVTQIIEHDRRDIEERFNAAAAKMLKEKGV